MVKVEEEPQVCYFNGVKFSGDNRVEIGEDLSLLQPESSSGERSDVYPNRRPIEVVVVCLNNTPLLSTLKVHPCLSFTLILVG